MAPMINRTPSAQEEPLQGSKRAEIPLGEYLFLRICQANPKMRSVFGIPGDFNLSLLEHLYSDSVAAQVEFVGFCNELNAAYAADGYAKVMESLSVLITTFGVGELSALNGISGAFAEYAPILHIVGTTSLKQQDQAKEANPAEVRNFHHLVQNKNPLAAPNHDVYKSLVGNFSVRHESLDRDMELNLAKIDAVLAAVLHERRPGYIFVPSDLPDVLVPLGRLDKPLELSELRDKTLLHDISRQILLKLYAAEKPSILADALADRFGAQGVLDKFIGQMPANFVKLFTTPLGRNVDETLPNFVGVYAGKMSSAKDVVEELETRSDFLLLLGFCNNEINAGSYSANFSKISEYVEVHPDYVLIDGEYILVKDAETGKRRFSIVDLIGHLSAEFKPERLSQNHSGINNIPAKKELEQFSRHDTVPAHVITQNKLIDFFNAYLRPNDILVCETCSFLFGISDLRFPKGVKFFSQNFYGSIGYALPATFGVSRAEHDLGTKRRVLLIQGDGSAQMTIQELSTFLRYDTKAPEIFLLNNEGYTVERVIKGPTRSYNDIQNKWEWTNFFKVFGDKDCEKHESEILDSADGLEQLLARKSSSKIRLFELKLDRMDVPNRFKKLLGKA